jgi:hypothetical protein
VNVILFAKAFIAWSDTASEKCWRNWLRFKNEEQIERNEQMLVHQQLAGEIVSSEPTNTYC